MTLPTNIDATYADSGTDASVQLHQQYHDTIHAAVNAFNAAESVNTVSASGATQTLSSSYGIHNVKLTANCAFTLPTPTAGANLTLILTQDPTGGRTPSFASIVRWDGDVTPSFTTTSYLSDVVSFLSVDGTYWIGFVGAQGLRLFDPTVPDAPTSLSATPNTAGSAVDLTWTAPPNGGAAITDYVIQYRTTAGPGSWNTFSDGTSTATFTTVTGLTNGTSYDFHVAAVNSVGTSAYSGTASATPAVSAIATDTFTRADSTTLGTTETGSKTWVKQTTGTSTVLAISSNKLAVTTSGSNGAAQIDTGVTDMDASIDIGFQSDASLIVRGQAATTANNKILCQLTTSGRRIAKLTSGNAYTALASDSTAAVNGTTYTVRGVVHGNVITMYVNGTQVLTYTLTGADATTYAANTGAGVSGDAAGLTFDNFTVSPG